MTSVVLLSFDAEEFDIPLEYGHPVDDRTQLELGARGLEVVLDLLDRLSVPATFFTTARLALARPELVRRAAQHHEIASHGWRHSSFCEEDLSRSRGALERVSGTPVIGFRRPRMAPTDHGAILRAGYRYNSSENPTWIPGRYNAWRAPRTPYFSGELLNVPASVTPCVRFPLFWLSFKNFPSALIKAASARTLATDGYLSLYFHPWEFVDIRGWALPRHVRRMCGPPLVERLESYIHWLRQRARPITFTEFDAAARSPIDPHRSPNHINGRMISPARPRT